MRALVLALPLVLLAAPFALRDADAQPPCPPDTCCKGPLNCLGEAVRRWLNEIGFADVCHATDEGYVCVALDPRSTCRVYEADAAGWRCVL